ncbi:MAG: ATP-binding protein [Methanomicrobiales archaeon]
MDSYCALMKKTIPYSQDCLEYLTRIAKASKKIQQTISFTKDYQELGMNNPLWQDIGKIARMAAVDLLPETVDLVVRSENHEIFADPMLILVFYNLFENVKRNWEKATKITIGFVEEGKSGNVIVEDNGIGIPANSKDHILERGFCAHAGFGLFPIREILAITCLSIKETVGLGK